MRSLIFICLLFHFYQPAFAQEVPKKQKSLVTKITATWCRICGEAAWDNFKEMIANNNENAVFIAAHVSPTSNLHSKAAKEYAKLLPNLIGQPTFYINREKLNENILQEAQNKININSQQSPVANSMTLSRLKDGQIQIEVKTKFFQASADSFYLNLLVTENKVINDQASRGKNVLHEKVLRASIYDDYEGLLINHGNIKNNEEKIITANIPIDPKWDIEHLEIISIIWKKENNHFQFVNANTELPNLSTLIKESTPPVITFDINPTILNTNAQIDLKLNQTLKKVAIDIYDVHGRICQSLFKGKLNKGNHKWIINKSTLKNRGIYYLNIKSEGKQFSKKILIP